MHTNSYQQIGLEYVGVSHPLFFPLPENEDKDLGVRVHDGLVRHKQSINTAIAGGSSQRWGKDDWPPERIIPHYGPATWNPNEAISGAQEPICNLNCII